MLIKASFFIVKLPSFTNWESRPPDLRKFQPFEVKDRVSRKPAKMVATGVATQYPQKQNRKQAWHPGKPPVKFSTTPRKRNFDSRLQTRTG
ncbi:hypothetical protein MKZ38_000059 [Zalerion maritima]|uniref:Uncharacterized protein n=1 Tax=Zalerion maritima TaxID=339359 RepID=A0AAD5WMS6_9PEZI|nr:hypothetical protein MKZ38_000059 [Zalerion maritima]